MDPRDEGMLIDLARSGDREAMDALLRLHAPAAHAFALRLSGNGTAAEDILQSALVKAYGGLRAFRGDARFRTWLFRILLNEHRSHARGRRNESLRQAEAEAMSLAARVAPVDRPDGALTTVELGRLVSAHVAALPPRPREALTLLVHHGCTYAEISTIMNCSYDAVKVHISAARRQLREALKGYLLTQ